MQFVSFLFFFSSLLLFLIIKNSIGNIEASNSKSYSDHIEKMLSLFLILVAVHILISVTIKFFPPLGSAFKPFLSRNVDILDIHGRGGIERISSFMMTPEIYGEIIALLCPVVMYKIFKFKKSIWDICLLIYGIGMIFSVTRSGIVLLALGMFFSMRYYSKFNIGKVITISYILMMSIIIIIFINPSFFGDVVQRFQSAIEIQTSGGEIYETINRKIFLEAWETVTSNITLFGNGITEYNFHNLLLTTVHKNGIIGASLFFAVLLYPFIKLIKSYKVNMPRDKTIIFTCILSLVLFFINEIKFEFYRGSGYDQICWGLFAIYYLVSKYPLKQWDNQQIIG